MDENMLTNHADRIREQREFFDSLAPSWREQKPIECGEIEELLKNISLESGNRVLDVACGAGVLAECLLKIGIKGGRYRYFSANDRKARNNRANDGVHFAVADFYSYESKSRYDCCLCSTRIRTLEIKRALR